MLAFLFILTSFSFLPFGLNGVRNGIACHLCLLAIALYLDDKRIAAGIIAFIILGVHRSVILPIAAGIAAVTVIRNPKTALIIWLASIPVSLIAGNYFSDFIMSIGFDDRMTKYAGGSLRGMNHFSGTGFRWDFLVYSALPVAFYYYVNIWKGLRDGWYNVIATIYMLSNAFWIIVIRAEFSNRFAYLSWFLMPVMLAYPLANMKVVEWQRSLSAITLTVYFVLTLSCYYNHQCPHSPYSPPPTTAPISFAVSMKVSSHRPARTSNGSSLTMDRPISPDRLSRGSCAREG